ncbi:hypothetical protein C8J57DRAFT_1465507 [Mycena rebaudengoi]|nr:hypothetical protein C8J57DRAFT_1465507 [Mycena rebaudengoi]
MFSSPNIKSFSLCRRLYQFRTMFRTLPHVACVLLLRSLKAPADLAFSRPSGLVTPSGSTTVDFCDDASRQKCSVAEGPLRFAKPWLEVAWREKVGYVLKRMRVGVHSSAVSSSKMQEEMERKKLERKAEQHSNQEICTAHIEPDEARDVIASDQGITDLYQDSPARVSPLPYFKSCTIRGQSRRDGERVSVILEQCGDKVCWVIAVQASGINTRTPTQTFASLSPG